VELDEVSRILGFSDKTRRWAGRNVPPACQAAADQSFNNRSSSLDHSLAQQRYNELLIAQLPRPEGEVRVIDIGCGAGHLLRQLLDRGYRADGVIPARDLARAVRGRLADFPGYRSRLFECRLELVFFESDQSLLKRVM